MKHGTTNKYGFDEARCLSDVVNTWLNSDCFDTYSVSVKVMLRVNATQFGITVVDFTT